MSSWFTIPGDNYAEIVESLNRLADAKLQLSIVPRADRG